MIYTNAAEVKLASTAISSMSTLSDADIDFYAVKVSAVIDASISSMYALPFTSIPPVIRSIAIDLTLCSVLKKRIFSSNRIVDEGLVNTCEDTQKLLDRIGVGKYKFLDSAGALIPVVGDMGESAMTAAPWIDNGH